MLEREKLVGNLMFFFPLIFKKLMKGFPTFEISKQQFELLFSIKEENGRTMSHYSEKMMISKPNLTVIADKLIEESLIERVFDPNDRRVVNLKITVKGEEFICEHRKKVREAMLKKLEYLSDNDVKRSNELIEELKGIFNKVCRK